VQTKLDNPTHKIHHGLDYLGKLVIFLLVVYFVIGDKDYIQVAKKFKTPKMKISKLFNFDKLWIPQVCNLVTHA
jgi:hypothetical protein